MIIKGTREHGHKRDEGTRCAFDVRGKMVKRHEEQRCEEKSHDRHGGTTLQIIRGNMVIHGTREHGQKRDEGTW